MRGWDMKVENYQSSVCNIKCPFWHKINVKVAKDTHILAPLLDKISAWHNITMIFYDFSKEVHQFSEKWGFAHPVKISKSHNFLQFKG